MATSSKNSATWTWPWCECGDVGVDDWFECSVAWSRDSYRFTVTDCQHYRISGDESACCPCSHSVAAISCLAVCCPVHDCGGRNCNAATVDDDTNFVCVHLVAITSNYTIVEIEKTRHYKFGCVNGNAVIEHCMFIGVGSLFNSLEELGVSGNNDSCTNNIVTRCIFRDFKFETHEKLRKNCIKSMCVHVF
ncbi:MAG: hypothetical protein RIR69_294 [Actinomycetota bacterium]